MTAVSQWSINRKAWLLLGLSALGFEFAALYFQYAMKLEPCIMCIYQRVAVMGVMFSGFITAIAPQIMLMRIAGFGLWGVSAIWGMLIVIEHYGIQTETDPFKFHACELNPNFPDWFQIHQWFPAVFEVRGDCGTVDWVFLNMSMVQWMIVVFALYSAAFAVVFLSTLIKMVGGGEQNSPPKP